MVVAHVYTEVYFVLDIFWCLAFVEFACSYGFVNMYEMFGFYVACKKYNGVNAKFLLITINVIGTQKYSRCHSLSK